MQTAFGKKMKEKSTFFEKPIDKSVLNAIMNKLCEVNTRECWNR